MHHEIFYGLTSLAIELNRFEILKYLYAYNHHTCSKSDLLLAINLNKIEMISFLQEHQDVSKCNDCELLHVKQRSNQINFLKICNIDMSNICPMNDVTIRCLN